MRSAASVRSFCPAASGVATLSKSSPSASALVRSPASAYRAREFRQLVEEQHAEMGETDFARLHLQPAADQGRHRCGMMRRTEWAHTRDRAVAQLARQTLHHGDFEGFTRIERRQQTGKPA